MLNAASKGKDLAEKQLVVLGGSPEQQREFLATLNPEPIRPSYSNIHKSKPAPVSNKHALGYTYQDVLDTDQEDTLARLNVWMLSRPALSFAPLLKPLLTPKTIPNTLVTILLDWSDPFKWPRQLRQWIRLLRSVILSLDDETKIVMEENMTAWKERRAGPDAPSTMPGVGAAAQEVKQTPIIPLGPGEWEEGLGVPLSVVCINASKIERMERDYGWQEEQFDFVLQWLRCVLLKHGASLVYTTSFDPNHVKELVHTSLGIHSMLKREVVKHNIIERDKILVPPNWDSWGKIRILREGFELETVGDAWSVEIQDRPEEVDKFDATNAEDREQETNGATPSESAVGIFESAFPDPELDRNAYKAVINPDAEVSTPDTQKFLAQQQKVIEQLKVEDDKAGKRSRKAAPTPLGGASGVLDDRNKSSEQMEEHVGHYQLNVGGIQVDAEEETRRLREREANRSRGDVSPTKSHGSTTPLGEHDANKGTNDAYKDFFANLIRKGKAGDSGRNSPHRAASER